MDLPNITEPAGVQRGRRTLQHLLTPDRILLEIWIPSGLIRVIQGTESQSPLPGSGNQFPISVSYLFKGGKQ